MAWLIIHLWRHLFNSETLFLAYIKFYHKNYRFLKHLMKWFIARNCFSGKQYGPWASSYWYVTWCQNTGINYSVYCLYIYHVALHIWKLKTDQLCFIHQGRSRLFLLFMPPRLKIGGHIVFVLSVILSVCHSVILSFCHSVLLSETLTLLITFEQWVLELWYFTWIFSVIRPFPGYHYFLPCDLDLGVWPIFWKL